MNATYTLLSPAPQRLPLTSRRRRTVRASWLAALLTLSVGLPIGLGVSYVLSGPTPDDEAAFNSVSAQTVAELALPDLPEGDQAAVLPPISVADASALAVPATDPADMTAVPEDVTDPAHRVIRLEWGDTLLGLLAKVAVPDAEAHEAMAALRTVYNPRDLKAGEEVTVNFDDAGIFKGFEFEPEADRAVRVERNGDSYRAASIARPLSNNVMAAVLTIDGSLYEAGVRAGIPSATMAGLVKALSYSVDFQRDIKSGDKLRVLYEVKRNPEGVLVRAGDVLFAEVSLQGRTVPVYLYKFADGHTEYLDRAGNSLRRALMRTPVNAARVSSGFGMRRHPIMGYSRMHKGVDFAAPTGTPIYAAGDGTIVERGWKRGYGNFIRIRHNGTLATAYGHMSRFSSSFTRGSRVRQGQVIGYVGSTGNSTGPHLHFEVMVNGTQVNPMRVANMSAGERLGGRDLTNFRSMVTRIESQFDAVEAGNVVEVSYNSPTRPTAEQAKRVAD